MIFFYLFTFNLKVLLNNYLYKLRSNALEFAYKKLKDLYDKPAYQTTKEELTCYPKESLGYQLAQFYKESGFDLIPKTKTHDVVHVLTGYKPIIEDEIAIQYFLCGNGKRSIYLLVVITIGTLVFPEFIPHFKTAFAKGRAYKPFYHWNFSLLLHTNFNHIQSLLTN